jgi:hypothetical protein
VLEKHGAYYEYLIQRSYLGLSAIRHKTDQVKKKFTFETGSVTSSGIIVGLSDRRGDKYFMKEHWFIDVKFIWRYPDNGSWGRLDSLPQGCELHTYHISRAFP